MATEHVRRRSSILENVTVEILSIDSVRVLPLIELLGNAAAGKVHGMIGPQDLRVSHLFTPVVTRRLQIPSVTYVIPEDNLVDSGLYYRTLPSNTYIVNAMISLLDHFQWYRIGLVNSGSEQYLEVFEMFMMSFSGYLKNETNGLVDVEYIESFTNEAQLNHSVQHFAAEGINVVFAFTEPPDAVKMICRASQTGLTGSGHVWVLPAYTDPNWWKKLQNLSNCTEDELLMALESVIFVAPTKYPPFTQETHDHDPQKFMQDLLNVTGNIFNFTNPSDTITPLLTHSHAVSAYDALWTIARTWNSVLTESECENDSGNLTQRLEMALKEISDGEFEGVWGDCSVVSRPEDSQKYYGTVLITQFQGGWQCPVALVLPHTRPSKESIVLLSETEVDSCPAVVEQGRWIKNFSCPSAVNCTYEFQWRGELGPPSSPFSVVDSEISVVTMALVFILVVLLMALTISLAIYNIKYRTNKFVKATSPRLSIGITVGLVLILPSTLFQGLASSAGAYSISGWSGDCLCWFTNWVIVVGLGLLYATLLAKNYRIYRIFYNRKLKVKQEDGLTDGALLGTVVVLVLPILAGCIASIWNRDNSLTAVIIPLDASGTSLSFIRISYCTLPHIVITGYTSVYLYLLLLPVITLAILTMRVKSRFGMDGRASGGIVMAIIVTSGARATVFGIVSMLESPNGYVVHFYTYVVFIFTLSISTLGFIYIPLYYNMYKEYKRNKSAMNFEDEAMESERGKHYNDLLSQANDLRKQLNEIELKLQKSRENL